MKKDDAFIKKIDEYLKKDIDGFIKAVNAEFKSNPFTIYGLNISVYLLKNERNSNSEEVYEVYSLDCSQNLTYYNSIWKKYLEIYKNKFSHFEFNGHTDKGWYDKDVVFPKEKKIIHCFKDLGKLEKVENIILSDVEKEEKPNTDIHFINVDDGWVKFINDLETHSIQRAFNLSWVSSYIHIPNSEFLDYPKWYVSCYLLVDVGNKINDKRFYKRAFRPAISKLLFNTSLSFHELLIENKQSNLELQATRAAIADIINRNYAHHIGSHVSHRATFDKILERLDITFQPTSTLLHNSLATIAQLRNKLETYKDQRSEFIAGITNYPVYQSFWLYKDVLLPFIENTLLIDNIAANEGIRYYQDKNNEKLTIETAKKSISKLIIRLWIDKDLIGGKKVCEATCEEQEKLTKVQEGFVEQFACYKVGSDSYTSLCLPYYREVKNLHDNFFDDKGFNLAYSDIRISLPGTLGNHAIYSLLENYIRNTAKHAYKPEEHKDFVEIILKLSANKKQDSDDYMLTITDNISDGNKAEELQGKISSKLSKIGIEKNESKGGMGIADMKICATLLKGLELTEENMRSSIYCHKNNEHIAYSLTLLKPRELALIGNTGINENTSEGIYYYENVEAYLKDRERGYRFAIVDSDLIDATSPFSRHWLPLRTIMLDNSTDKNGLSYINGCVITSKYVFNINSHTVIERCWLTWLKGKLGDQFEKIQLGVYFEQKDNEIPTKNWVEKNFQGHCFYDVESGGQILKSNKPDFPKDEKLHILFDRHGGLIKKATNIKFIENNFYELIDKNNPDFNLLFTADIQSEPFMLHYEMIDAGMLNVLVIDERVAEVAYKPIDNYTQYNELLEHGFYKPKHDKTQHQCTIFDACWATHTYIATHLSTKENCFTPLSKEINPDTEHYLKVTFTKGESENKIVTKCEFNIMGYKCNPSFQGIKVNKWICSDSQQNNETSYSFHTKFDCLLIHRTKLDEILKQLKIDFDQFAQMIDIPKIYVVTGGGTVDFVEDQQKITILPTNIIKDFIMGSRPAKISLSQILK